MSGLFQLPVSALVARARTFFAALQSDADTAAPLADVGLNADAVAEALALVATVEAADRAQKTEYAEQYAATREVARLTEALRVPYVRHVRLARVVFERGSFGHDLLALGGDRADTPTALLAQARHFYAVVAHTDVAPALARVRVTPAVAAEQMARIAALEAALVAQRRETGEAQQATRARDVEEARLRALLSDSEELARVVLADTPQARERLGLLER